MVLGTIIEMLSRGETFFFYRKMKKLFNSLGPCSFFGQEMHLGHVNPRKLMIGFMPKRFFKYLTWALLGVTP